ncbi:hypothetical protein [Actinosynnema sp. NPDC020468]|uniref:hypothetical protein n=1 Tax=Actinosynnema sp. NPDC020468 TaxID=3154488 RepID=UPI0033FC9FCD
MQRSQAARTVAHNSLDDGDLRELLRMLDLPDPPPGELRPDAASHSTEGARE